MRPGPVMLPTPREFLENLNRQACGKMDVAAAILGFSDRSRVSRLFTAHGVKWRSCRDFDYRGTTDTLRGHCIRLGISFKRAKLYRQRHGGDSVATLDYYVNRSAAQ
jgi:hypothetical protein